MNKSWPLIFLILILLGGCIDKTDDLKGKIEYNGPIMDSKDINVTLSDSGLVKIKLSTAQQLRFANGNEIYPKTVYVTFIDQNGAEYSRLRGDSARYERVNNLYVVKGNVLINNTRENQSLATEELFWNPNEKRIYSEKKVNIKTPKQDFTALAGMDASEDFSRYTLRKSRGTVVVDSIRTIVDTTSGSSLSKE